MTAVSDYVDSYKLREISLLVKSLRLKLRYTQKQMAQELGVSDLSISRWENKRGYPSNLAMKQIMLLSEDSSDS